MSLKLAIKIGESADERRCPGPDMDWLQRGSEIDGKVEASVEIMAQLAYGDAGREEVGGL